MYSVEMYKRVKARCRGTEGMFCYALKLRIL